MKLKETKEDVQNAEPIVVAHQIETDNKSDEVPVEAVEAPEQDLQKETPEIKEEIIAPVPNAAIEASKRITEEQDARKRLAKELLERGAKIRKNAIHSRTIPPGHRIPSTVSELNDLAKETGLQLYLDEKWSIVSHELEDGSTIQAVVPTK